MLNPNAKGTLKDWLTNTTANILLVQEVKANEQEAQELNEFAKKTRMAVTHYAMYRGIKSL